MDKKTGLDIAIVFLFVLVPLLFVTSELQAGAKPVVLRKGMVITHSVTIRKQEYFLTGSNDTSSGVITIKGDHIIIDFDSAILHGSKDIERPDEFYGFAIYVKEGSDITIKNAIIRGYKVGIFGSGVHNLKIENCDLSYNFRQHLNSNRFREDMSDWQSYHNNENGQWLRFGAGIYLRNCDSAVVKNNVITQGQCGLMMVNSNANKVSNNNFSFNSGIGIGLYRSSYNTIMYNKVDWNVRGVSEGYYYRGQDAAALLIYEQSSHNVVAYNSATHSGDGIFLFAGNSTIKTGTGGCNDNLIYGNDCSYAPANGVEATFSRNKIINNKIIGCDYGVWGGYSYNTLIQGNLLEKNNTGVAIEQGQNNRIIGNIFSDGTTGISLWATPGRKMDGRYDVTRDVSSMHYVISDNSFKKLITGFNFSNTHDISIQNNRIENVTEWIKSDSSISKISFKDNGSEIRYQKMFFDDSLLHSISRVKKAMWPTDHLNGRKYIIMTPWGPYDFRSPKLWWTKTDSSGKMYFDVLGPIGKWKFVRSTGVKNISAESGMVPGKVSFERNGSNFVNVELEYDGSETTSPFGKKYPAGTPYIFGYRKTFLNENWSLELFSFNSSNDPLKHPELFQKLINTSKPALKSIVPELSNSYWASQREKVPPNQLCMVAMSTIQFPKGKYVLGVSASEMVRVYVDNKRIINAWDPSKIIYDADAHHQVMLSLKGSHTIRVEQVQYGGYGMLYLTIIPVKEFNEY